MTQNNKYANGKIYKITDNAYTKCYIGSTEMRLWFNTSRSMWCELYKEASPFEKKATAPGRRTEQDAKHTAAVAPQRST